MRPMWPASGCTEGWDEAKYCFMVKSILDNPGHVSQALCRWCHFLAVNDLSTWLLRGFYIHSYRSQVHRLHSHLFFISTLSLKATLEQAALPPFPSTVLEWKRVEISWLVGFWLSGVQERLPSAKHKTTEDFHCFNLSRPCCIMWG